MWKAEGFLSTLPAYATLFGQPCVHRVLILLFFGVIFSNTCRPCPECQRASPFSEASRGLAAGKGRRDKGPVTIVLVSVAVVVVVGSTVVIVTINVVVFVGIVIAIAIVASCFCSS